MAATTAFGIGDYTNALQKVIQPYIQDNIPSQTKLLQVLKKNDNVQVFNNQFFAPVRTNRHGGVVNLASDKSTLRTGNAPVGQASINQKLVTGTFDISDVAIKSSASNKLAVTSALEFEMKSLKTDFAKSLNRQYMSDGFGVIAMVQGSLTSTTLSVVYPGTGLDDTRAIYYGTQNLDIKPTKYFAPGQAIAIGSAGTALGTITSTGVAGGSALGTLTLTAALNAAVAGSQAIYLVDGDGAGAGTSEIQGVRLALSEGTANYAGVARSNDIWAPQYLGTASSAALSINDMEVIYMSAYEYAQEGDRYAWFMNKTLYTKFGDLVTALRRTVDKMELVSGWSGLAFEAGMGNVPVMLDFDVPDGEAFLLNLDTWTVCQVADMGFVQDQALRRSDYITFQKVFSWYTNLLCVCPAANGRMVRRTK